MIKKYNLIISHRFFKLYVQLTDLILTYAMEIVCVCEDIKNSLFESLICNQS